MDFFEFDQNAIDRLRQEVDQCLSLIDENLKGQSSDCLSALSRSTRNQLDTLIWLLNAKQTLEYIDSGVSPATLIYRCLDFCSDGGVKTPDPLSATYRCSIVKSVLSLRRAK